MLSSSYLIKPRCKGYGCESDIPHVFNPKTVLKKNSKSLKKPDISSLEKKWFWTWQRAFITFLILPQYKTFVTCNKGNYVLNIKIRNHNINLNNIKIFLINYYKYIYKRFGNLVWIYIFMKLIQKFKIIIALLNFSIPQKVVIIFSKSRQPVMY